MNSVSAESSISHWCYAVITGDIITHLYFCLSGSGMRERKKTNKQKFCCTSSANTSAYTTLCFFLLCSLMLLPQLFLRTGPATFKSAMLSMGIAQLAARSPVEAACCASVPSTITCFHVSWSCDAHIISSAFTCLLSYDGTRSTSAQCLGVDPQSQRDIFGRPLGHFSNP